MGDRDVSVVDVKRLSLIDVSFEDDCLIDTSPARPAGPQFMDDELLRGLDIEKASEEGKEMAAKPLESTEERASKTPENYSLRKSLAWDTAFFTSDGVLEPEELTSMIEDAGKRQKHVLPMILEETQRSTESISTLASDTLTLASLEAELFEDIRASIQKSGRTPNIRSSNSEAGQSSLEAHSHHSSGLTRQASQDKLKAKPAPKKSGLGMPRPGKTTNQVPVHRRISQVQPIAAKPDSNSNSMPSKPPKPGTSCSIPSSTKRDSIGANRMKPEKNNAESGTGRGTSAPKVPVPRGTRSNVPRPLSSRSSSALSASVEKETIPPSSDSSASDSSDKIKKSMNLTKKGLDPRSRKLSTAGSCTLKTPPKTGASPFSARTASATKLSSSISPASSISEWSSESSSSSSTVQQRSNVSRASLESSSSRKSCDDSDKGQQLDGPKTHSSTQRLKNASTGAMLPPNSTRPTGLRMPSPKLGFFDGMKSGRTPNVNQPTGTTDKGRTATAIGSTKGDSKQASSVGSGKSLPPKSSNSAEKVPSALRNVKRSSPGISPRIQSRLSPKLGSRNQLKAEETKPEDKEIDEKRLVDKERPEVTEPWSSNTNAIDGGLKTSNVVTDSVDKESHIENGSVINQSLTSDPFEIAPDLISKNLPVCDQTDTLNCLSKLSLSPSVAKVDTANSARQPFNAIDSLCNMGDSFDASMGMATAEHGKRTDLPSQSPIHENS